MSRPPSAMAAIVMTICGGFLLHSCVAGEIRWGSNLERSKATLAPSETWRSFDGRLTGPGMELEIIAQNARRTRGWVMPASFPPLPPLPDFAGPGPITPPRPFRIRVTFSPVDQRFTLVPRGAVLITHRGERRQADDLLDCRLYAKVEQPTPVTTGMCIVLVFDMEPPLPKDEFSLVLEGLERDGVPFPVPLIHFSRVTE